MRANSTLFVFGDFDCASCQFLSARSSSNLEDNDKYKISLLGFFRCLYGMNEKLFPLFSLVY